MRVVKLLCTFVTISLLGSGCAELSSLSESGQESNVDSSVGSNGSSSDSLGETEKIVTEFMNALVSHDTETVARIGGSQSYSAYSFLDGVVFSDWELVDSKNDEDVNSFTIKMNISESSEEAFPVGESVWTIEASEGGDEYFSSFFRNGAEEKTVLANNVSNLDVSDAVKMCYAFTSEFGWVSSDESIIDMSGVEKIVEKERFIGDLIKFCSYFSNDDELSGSIVDYSAEKLSESAEKLLGVNDLDFTVLPSYNKAKNTVSNKRTKYCWGYASLAEEQYDSKNGIHRVTIDWYSDTILLAKAKSIEYILLDNPDGSIRLYSTEKIFDNGEPIAFMTRSNY